MGLVACVDLETHHRSIVKSRLSMEASLADELLCSCQVEPMFIMRDNDNGRIAGGCDACGVRRQ